jgi:signal peptidase I
VTQTPPVDSLDEPTPASTTSETDATTTAPKRSKASRKKVLLEWATIIIIAVLASLIVRTFVFQTYFIPSASMEPTLMIGDRIIVNKLSVDFGTIHTGDIIVFKAPPAEDCGTTVADLVKRVIGVPGDKLTSRGNTIYINGKALDETWSHVEPLGTPIGHVTVKPGQYFVMGDNHPDSCDSRFWGTVPRSDIIGKVFLRIWPLSRIGFL